jgi:hypothetical protein
MTRRAFLGIFVMQVLILHRADGQDLRNQMNDMLSHASLAALNGNAAVDVGEVLPLAITFPGAERVSMVTKEPVSLDIVLQSGPVAGAKDLIGTITGAIPVVRSVLPEVIVIKAEFYSDDGSTKLDNNRYRILPTSNPTQLGAVLVPPISELTTTMSEAVYYTLRITIKLRIGSDDTCVDSQTTCTEPKEIEQRIPFRRLGIPTVFAGFENDNFGGAALIVVPTNSPLGASSVLSQLGTALTGLSQLYDAVKLAADWNPALPDLDLLKEAIAALPGGAVFRKTNDIDELEDITVVEGRCCGRGDADNFFDSVIFIAVDEKVQLFSDESQHTQERWFSVHTPSDKSHVAVLVDNLDKNPGSRPSGRVTEHGDNETFHDQISSLRFRN